MIPPLLYRCPDCGKVTLARRFRTVVDADRRVVECPACRYRFEPVDDPRLA